MLSTEELQRLLDEATPGEWAIDEETGRIYSQKDGVIISGIDLYQKIDPEYSETEPWIDWHREVDGFFASHGPDFAAEVIRLREENEELTKLRFDHH